MLRGQGEIPKGVHYREQGKFDTGNKIAMSDKEFQAKVLREIASLKNKLDSLIESKTTKLSVKEYAKQKGCSRQTIVNHINQGLLNGIKVGGKYYVFI